MTPDAERAELAAIERSLAALRDGSQPLVRFAQDWRTSVARLSSLPPAFAAVMEDSLARLESAGLFSEESCSFSQQDLLDGVALWIRRAEARLARPQGRD